jgi:hypothetical protein
MPVTTGQFTTPDMLFSLLYKMSDLLVPTSKTGERMTRVHYDGLELSDWVVWAILHDNGRAWTAKVFRGYCQAMYKVNDAARDAVPDAIRQGYEQARLKAYGFLAAAIKKQAAGRIRHSQIDGYDFEHSIDPTHTMVAKDANDHPLHDLAGILARIAVLDVGRCVADVWESKAGAQTVLDVAAKYFKHPAYTDLLDSEVLKWRNNHQVQIKQASDQKAALKRAEHRQHGAHHDGKVLPKNAEPAWQFWTMHYKELTGQDDVLPIDAKMVRA